MRPYPTAILLCKPTPASLARPPLVKAAAEGKLWLPAVVQRVSEGWVEVCFLSEGFKMGERTQVVFEHDENQTWKWCRP